MRVILTVILIVLVAVMARPATASVPPAPCPTPNEAFLCGVLTVPLDRSGATRRIVKLHYAIQATGPAPILLELVGGPGQAGLDSLRFLPTRNGALQSRYRLAALDQRGTGKSGALKCSALTGWSLVGPVFSFEDCAKELGPTRALYTTADTVLDIEDLRAALGAPTLALVGTSYGTHVAQQYARAFPAHVERLILNSTVGPDGDPAYPNLRAIPRALHRQCAAQACRDVTPTPAADLAAVVRQLPLTGNVYDDAGKLQEQTVTEHQLVSMIKGGDIAPRWRAYIPAALRAAAHHDPALLLRLAYLSEESLVLAARQPEGLLSMGLYAAAICQDSVLPYALDSPLAQRSALVHADTPRAWPFHAETVRMLSHAHWCQRWPRTRPRPRIGGPLPNVPALILAGGQDVRTPPSDAAAVAAQLPQAQLVVVDGVGHDVIGQAVKGCVGDALARFAANEPAAPACAGKRYGFPNAPRPPATLGDVAPAPGVDGVRGRVVAAVRATVSEVLRLHALTRAIDVPRHGGGLRGGSWELQPPKLVVRRYEYIRGVRLSGVIMSTGGQTNATIHVRGRLSGSLRAYRTGAISGILDGVRVRSRTA